MTYTVHNNKHKPHGYIVEKDARHRFPSRGQEQAVCNAAAASCPVEEAYFLGAHRSLWDAGSESRVCVCGVVYLTYVTLHLAPH